MSEIICKELVSKEAFSSVFLSVLFFLFFFFRIDSVILFRSDFNVYYFLASVISIFIIKANFNLYSPVFYLLFALFSWMFVILIGDFFFVIDVYDSFGKSQLDYRLNIFLNSVVFFLMGFVFYEFNVFKCLKKNKFLFLLFFVFNFFLFFLYFDGEKVSYLSISQGMSSGWVNHLYFGSAVVFLSAVTLSLFSGWFRFWISFLVFILLFFLKGSSALVISFMSLFFIYISVVSRKNVVFIFFSFVFCLVFFPPFLYVFFYDDLSFLERVNLFLEGLPYIPDQLLFGRPELILHYSEGYGGYFHNVLSMVQFYGFFPFFVLFSLYVIFLYKSLSIVRVYKVDGILFLFLFLLFYSFFSLIFSKFISEWLVWFSIGLSSSIIMSKEFSFPLFKRF